MNGGEHEAGAENVAEVFDEIANIVGRHLSDRSALSATAAACLARLDREGAARLSALAAVECVSQPSMSQLVQRLERHGLVARVGDPDDGRASLIAITDAGRELLAERRRDRRDRLTDLLAALPAEDEAALRLAMQVALPAVRRLVGTARQTHPRTEPVKA